MTSSHVSTQTNQFHHDNQIIQCIWDSKSSIQTPAGAVCCSISKLHPPLQFLGGSDSPIHACTMLNKIRKIQVSTSTSKFQLGLEASSVQLFSTEKDFIDASTSFALKAGGVGLGHGWIVRDATQGSCYTEHQQMLTYKTIQECQLCSTSIKGSIRTRTTMGLLTWLSFIAKCETTG
ncbi:uncharacterized protein LOC111058355 isoform X3 [Nilaparvata lugens]|uniref:uncharacterized protein LOC111058355 isoform X3 n=1 Tax=Nilaparvata lugens TaxID=108931 RepID=UPI00193E11E5|nr:uncharacterized protein LOC111058355 isoform X3 [Nilaparvata lugens]